MVAADSGQMSNFHIRTPLVLRSPCQIWLPWLSLTITSVAVNVTVHWASHILPMPMRLWVKCGMMCLVRDSSGRWGMLIIDVADDVIDCPLVVLTDIGCAVPLMLYAGAVVMK